MTELVLVDPNKLPGKAPAKKSFLGIKERQETIEWINRPGSSKVDEGYGYGAGRFFPR